MIELKIKPLSVNVAWQGRRFKTPAYKKFEADVSILLTSYKSEKLIDNKDELVIEYDFYLKNYANTDVGNLEKQLTDILVKNGFIKDDRYIKRIILTKHRSETDKIEIVIKKSSCQ
jgi:Holliday junction resolvase RusA-like endonuclease